jgi:hypothetical protein
MKKFILEILSDGDGVPSLGRFGYFLTVLTTILWINIIFAVYAWHAYHGLPTPDLPAQVVMVIMTLLGGYLGSKGADVVSKWNIGANSGSTEAKIDQDVSDDDGPPKTKPTIPTSNK